MIKIDIKKYKKVPYTERKTCMICGTKISKPVIELPQFPMTEIYTPVKVKDKAALANQSFHLCPKCGHGQLGCVIDVNLQYGDRVAYNFRTSTSVTGRESADYFIGFIKKVSKGKSLGNVAEIGANDMYVLSKLEKNADKLTGIDPVLKGSEKEFTRGKMTAVGDFFENVLLSERFDTIICKDTLEHIENPFAFTRKIVEMGDKNTLFYFNIPFLETLVQSYRFDQIFHQHLNYYSLKSIIYMLNKLGCNLVDYEINYNHWGVIMFAFKKGKDTGKFKKDIKSFTPKEITGRYSVFKNSLNNTQAQIEVLEKDGEMVYGYGAAHMLPVLSYHLKNDFSRFGGIIDDDKNKDGLYYINLPVKIVHPSKIKDMEKLSILVTAVSAIHNTRRILSRLSDINPRRILVPLNTF